jgi:hypothetical protein
MLAVSWFMNDLMVPIVIGVILSITLQLDVLNDRTPQPIPGGRFQMGTRLGTFNGCTGRFPQPKVLYLDQ